MHKMTFFPINNGDTCLIELANGRKILFDYADQRNADDPDDLSVDLPMALRERLDGCDTIDIVAFTHPDQDHIAKAPEFFHLDHSPDHQGGDRIKITEMWVPSGTITEDASLDDAILLQKEAQHRLRHGEGIRVFSRPEELEEWFKREGIKREDRKKLCTDAGTCAPGFKLMDDGVEFFVHSPFATRQDDQTLIERNECSLVFQVRFEVDGVCTNVIMAADAPHAALTEMVNQTRSHDNEERLAWDIFKLLYSALRNGPRREANGRRKRPH